MSDLATYQSWIEPGFDFLDENWDDAATWDTLRAGFLSAIGVTEQDLSTPTWRVLGILVERVDAMAEHHRRFALKAAEERAVILRDAFTQWQQAPAEAETSESAAEGDEPVREYVAGRGLMQWDPATNEWVVIEPEAETTEAEAPAADSTGEPQYFPDHGWMRYDPTSGEWVPAEAPAGEQPHEEVPAPPPMPEATQPSASEHEQGEHEAEEVPVPPPVPGATQPTASEHEQAEHEGEEVPVAPPAPADVAQRATDDIILPAIADAMEKAPELASMPADQLEALLAEVLAERIAARAGS